jgi:hypothetical protein
MNDNSVLNERGAIYKILKIPKKYTSTIFIKKEKRGKNIYAYIFVCVKVDVSE